MVRRWYDGGAVRGNKGTDEWIVNISASRPKPMAAEQPALFLHGPDDVSLHKKAGAKKRCFLS